MRRTYTFMSRIGVTGAMVAISMGSVAAQNISKFVISDEAAKKALVRNEISVETAEKITRACVEFAKKNNQAVTVFILFLPARSCIPTGWMARSPLISKRHN